MSERHPEKKPEKRLLSFYRLVVCGCGLVVAGLAIFGLLLHGPLNGVLVIVGLIGLVLLCCGALTSDKTCQDIAEVISRFYD